MCEETIEASFTKSDDHNEMTKRIHKSFLSCGFIFTNEKFRDLRRLNSNLKAKLEIINDWGAEEEICFYLYE